MVVNSRCTCSLINRQSPIHTWIDRVAILGNNRLRFTGLPVSDTHNNSRVCQFVFHMRGIGVHTTIRDKNHFHMG